jgi:hypothetical protein
MGVSFGFRTAAHGAVQQALKEQGLSVEVRIIANGLSEIEALRFEMERIALHGRADVGTGALVNRTDGGSEMKWVHQTDSSHRGKLAYKEHRDKLAAQRQAEWLAKQNADSLSEPASERGG